MFARTGADQTCVACRQRCQLCSRTAAGGCRQHSVWPTAALHRDLPSHVQQPDIHPGSTPTKTSETYPQPHPRPCCRACACNRFSRAPRACPARGRPAKEMRALNNTAAREGGPVTHKLHIIRGAADAPGSCMDRRESGKGEGVYKAIPLHRVHVSAGAYVACVRTANPGPRSLQTGRNHQKTKRASPAPPGPPSQSTGSRGRRTHRQRRRPAGGIC